MNDRENALRIIRFDAPERVVTRPATVSLAYHGANHEGFGADPGGDDAPVGARSHQLLGPGPQAEAAAVMASQRLVEAFRADYREINCSDLTELSWKNVQAQEVLKYILTGRILNCFKM